MTILEFIMERCKKLSLPFKKEEVEVHLLLAELDPESEITKEIKLKSDKIFLDLVYDLLITPDITEGDYSVKFDRGAIKDWYSAQCSILGIEDLFLKKSDIVKDLSYLA